jgi:hypothetical protein
MRPLFLPLESRPGYYAIYKIYRDPQLAIVVQNTGVLVCRLA